MYIIDNNLAYTGMTSRTAVSLYEAPNVEKVYYSICFTMLFSLFTIQ